MFNSKRSDTRGPFNTVRTILGLVQILENRLQFSFVTKAEVPWVVRLCITCIILRRYRTLDICGLFWALRRFTLPRLLILSWTAAKRNLLPRATWTANWPTATWLGRCRAAAMLLGYAWMTLSWRYTTAATFHRRTAWGCFRARNADAGLASRAVCH